MKQTIAILLAFMVLSVILKDVAMYVLFKVNQDYIAATKCVNKDKKVSKYALNCNGQCYLKKTIVAYHESKENNSSIPFPTLEDQQEVQQIIQYFEIDNSKKVVYTSNLIHSKPNLYTQSFLQDIFHPPQSI